MTFVFVAPKQNQPECLRMRGNSLRTLAPVDKDDISLRVGLLCRVFQVPHPSLPERLSESMSHENEGPFFSVEVILCLGTEVFDSVIPA